MSDHAFRVVIPARFGSTRFPGKVLAEVAGKPVIEHVCDAARGSAAAEVIVATDDARIAEVCRGFGADVAMTRAYHESGTDRVAEVAEQRDWPGDTIVVNVQGDSPLLPSPSIDQVAKLMVDNPSADIATLCTAISDATQFQDPNIVKVVADMTGRALYFSRAPIPAVAHDNPGVDEAVEAWRHIGLYAYRVGSLAQLARMLPCALEKRERLEQLRALWNGMEIRVGVATDEHGPDVDTPEDLVAVERFFSEQAD